MNWLKRWRGHKVRSDALLGARREELLDWAETLLCNAVPMPHCTQDEWDATVKRWRDEKHGVSTPNEKDERRA